MCETVGRHIWISFEGEKNQIILFFNHVKPQIFFFFLWKTPSQWILVKSVLLSAHQDTLSVFCFIYSIIRQKSKKYPTVALSILLCMIQKLIHQCLQLQGTSSALWICMNNLSAWIINLQLQSFPKTSSLLMMCNFSFHLDSVVEGVFKSITKKYSTFQSINCILLDLCITDAF